MEMNHDKNKYKTKKNTDNWVNFKANREIKRIREQVSPLKFCIVSYLLQLHFLILLKLYHMRHIYLT